MGEHWSEDGGIYASVAGDSAHYALAGTTDKMALFKEVALLGASAWVAGFGLSAISAYRSVKDPNKGMPTLGLHYIEPGLDWVVASLGLLGGLFLGDWLGPTAQTVAIGLGLGGLTVTGVHYGAKAGAHMAESGTVKGLIDSTVASVKGLFSVGHVDRTANLSPEAQKVLAEYESA